MNKILLSDANIVSSFIKSGQVGKSCFFKLSRVYQLLIHNEVLNEIRDLWPDFKPEEWNLSIHHATIDEVNSATTRKVGGRSLADKLCIELFIRNSIDKHDKNYHLASSDSKVYNLAEELANKEFKINELAPNERVVFRHFSLLRVLIDNNSISKEQALLIAKLIKDSEPRGHLDVPYDSFKDGLFDKKNPPPDLSNKKIFNKISKSIIVVTTRKNKKSVKRESGHGQDGICGIKYCHGKKCQ